MPTRKHKPPVIKCLSVRQPWAALVVDGVKDIENRSWPTDYRGPLLIHASLKPDTEAREQYQLCSEPRGAIIGCVEVVDCRQLSRAECGRSKWAAHGQHHWILRNARRFRKPVPFTGKLRLFDVSRSILPEDLA
jgi:hypothetical protein